MNIILKVYYNYNELDKKYLSSRLINLEGIDCVAQFNSNMKLINDLQTSNNDIYISLITNEKELPFVDITEDELEFLCNFNTKLSGKNILEDLLIGFIELPLIKFSINPLRDVINYLMLNDSYIRYYDKEKIIYDYYYYKHNLYHAEIVEEMEKSKETFALLNYEEILKNIIIPHSLNDLKEFECASIEYIKLNDNLYILIPIYDFLKINYLVK